MKPIAYATVVLLTGWVSASAQQTRPDQPRAPQSDEPAHKVYVMRGCLEIGSGATSTFTLRGAEHIGQAPPSVATATSKDATVYELQPVGNFGEQGVSRDRLKGHVGKRVEVTVRPAEVAPAPSSPAGAADGASPPLAAARTEKPEKPLPRYTVVMISQLAESCQ